MGDLERIDTGDGSHSLFNRQLGETYHSIHGALRESVHVFIEAGWRHLLNTASPTTVKLLEVGFGTGLNALLTAKAADADHTAVEYHSLEAFPLSETDWNTLNYPALVDQPLAAEWFQLLHAAPWNKPCAINSAFTMIKHLTTLQAWEHERGSFDLIYYDAFAPSKQPEMWTLDVLAKTTSLLKPSGIFVTYCAKGQFKRDLKSLGLQVEALPGPPGKAEMVRGTKI